MAEPWWRQLGSKLVDAGQAYVQQVGLVQRLRTMTPDEARTQFAAYVEGLSATARSGFALTLAALAQAEQNPQVRQFVEPLRAALANPGAWAPPTSAPGGAPQGQSAAPPTADGAPASFEDDLRRVHEWYARPEASRPAAVTAALSALADGELATLRANLERMCANVASQIEAHHAKIGRAHV